MVRGHYRVLQFTSTMKGSRSFDMRTYKRITQDHDVDMLPLDSEVDTSVERRVLQGRKHVIDACFSVLNPVYSLPDSTFLKMNEILKMAQSTEYKSEQRVGVIGDMDTEFALQKSLGKKAIFRRLQKDQCMSAMDQVPFILDGPYDLIVADDLGPETSEAWMKGKYVLSIYIIILKSLNVGGTMIIRLEGVELEFVRTVIYTAMKFHFDGEVLLIKPEASRSASKEVYLLATARRYGNSLGAHPRVLEEWLEASQAQGAHDGNMLSSQLLAKNPIQMESDFIFAMEAWGRILTSHRHKATRKALELCRIIHSHHPLCTEVQMQTILSVCKEDTSFQTMAADYLKRCKIH